MAQVAPEDETFSEQTICAGRPQSSVPGRGIMGGVGASPREGESHRGIRLNDVEYCDKTRSRNLDGLEVSRKIPDTSDDKAQS